MKALINIMEDPIYHYEKKGFGSIIIWYIEIIDYYSKLNYTDYIIKDQRLCKVLDFLQEGTGENVSAMYLQEYLNGKILHNNNSFHIPNFEDIKNKNIIFNKHFFIKNKKCMDNKIEKIKISEKSHAFHIRGTDKFSEIKEIEINNVLIAIDRVLKHSDFIFISTDDEKYLKCIYDVYGYKKITHDETKQISFGNLPIHHRFSDLENNDKEAFEVAYTLSKFKNFSYSFSNLSHLALVLGVDNFSNIYNLNNLIEGWS
jgi:hypothetical protein